MGNFQIAPRILIFLTIIDVLQGYPQCEYQKSYPLKSFESSDRWTIYSFECSLKNVTRRTYLSNFRGRWWSLKINDSSLGILSSNDMDFYDNSQIYELFLNDTGIKMILPGVFNKMKNLHVLYLQNNELQEISTGAFISLTELRVLHLENNLLTTIDNSAFAELRKLTSLYLNDNSVSFLGNLVFLTIPNLQYLDISNNPLKNVNLTLSLYSFNANKLHLLDINFDQENFVLKNENNVTITVSDLTIKSISVSNNHFSTINQIQIPGINNINLSHNEMTRLDEKVFFKLNNLTTLDLHRNKLESLPPEIFCGLMSLKYLDLSDNNLKLFRGDVFSKLNNLTELYLGGNQLQLLSHDTMVSRDVFSKLNALSVLDLHGNKLESLPHGIFQNLTALTDLDVSNNNLKFFNYGTFDRLINLISLNLSTNFVEELNTYAFRASKYIKNLYLDSNQLRSIDLSYLNNLQIVSLDNNLWHCQDLSRIVYELELKEVKVIYGITHQNQNVHKIACDDIKLVPQIKNSFNSTDLDKYFTQIFSRIDNDLTKSKFMNFLNSDFKSSGFYKFITTFQKSEFVQFSENFSNTEFYKFFKDFKENYDYHPRLDKQATGSYEHLKSYERPSESSNSLLYFQVIGLYIIIVILIVFLYFNFSKWKRNYNITRYDNTQVELL